MNLNRSYYRIFAGAKNMFSALCVVQNIEFFRYQVSFKLFKN